MRGQSGIGMMQLMQRPAVFIRQTAIKVQINGGLGCSEPFLPSFFFFLPGLSFICYRLCRSGDEDVPHVPHREHQRREQAEGRREAGGEAVQQVRRPQRQPAASRRPPAEARLRQKNREDEREGEVQRRPSLSFGPCWHGDPVGVREYRLLRTGESVNGCICWIYWSERSRQLCNLRRLSPAYCGLSAISALSKHPNSQTDSTLICQRREPGSHRGRAVLMVLPRVSDSEASK